jgi:hypothetical protein
VRVEEARHVEFLRMAFDRSVVIATSLSLRPQDPGRIVGQPPQRRSWTGTPRNEQLMSVAVCIGPPSTGSTAHGAGDLRNSCSTAELCRRRSRIADDQGQQQCALAALARSCLVLRRRLRALPSPGLHPAGRRRGFQIRRLAAQSPPSRRPRLEPCCTVVAHVAVRWAELATTEGGGAIRWLRPCDLATRVGHRWAVKRALRREDNDPIGCPRDDAR